MEKTELARYFDALAPVRARYRRKGGYYHRKLEDYLNLLIPAGASVLEIGCGTGEFLARLNGSVKMGIDLSPGMIELARQNHPDIEFQVGDLEDLKINRVFDYILLVNVVGYLDDIQRGLDCFGIRFGTHNNAYKYHMKTSRLINSKIQITNFKQITKYKY